MRKFLLALSLMVCFALCLVGCGSSTPSVSKEDLNKLTNMAKYNQLTEAEFKTACSTLRDAGLDFSRIIKNTNNTIYLGIKEGDYIDKKRTDEWKAKGIKDADNILVITVTMDKKDGTKLIKNISATGGFLAKEGDTYYNYKKNFDISKLILSKKDAEKLREISEKELAKKLEKEAKEAKNMKVTKFLAGAYVDKGIISSDSYGYKTSIEAEYELKTVGETVKRHISNKITITKDFKVD